MNFATLSPSSGLPSLCERLGWTLLHFLWQGALVAGLLALVLGALRKGSASARYLATCLSLLCCALWPLVTFIAWTPPHVGRLDGAGTSVVATSDHRFASKAFLATGNAVQRSADADAVVSSSLDSSTPGAARPDHTWLATKLLSVCCVAWMVGVTAFSLRLLAGWVQAQRLRWSGTTPVTSCWQARLQTLADRLGITRVVRLLESTRVEVPTVVGHLRPVVLLPVGLLTGLPSAHVEAYLAHELAHVRRADYLVNLLQSTVETLLFYHPAVWWISACARREREHCCDDLAVQATNGNGAGYARVLADLEHWRGPVPRLALQVTGSPLLGRVRRLVGLPAGPQPRPMPWLAAMASCTALVSFLVWQVSGVPRLAAQDQPPATPSDAVVGQVADAQGHGVPDVEVQSVGRGTIQPAMTDSQGNFRLLARGFGGGTLVAHAKDDALGWVSNFPHAPIITLHPARAASGEISGTGGKPIAGVQVQVFDLADQDNNRCSLRATEFDKPPSWLARFATTTDASGHFSVWVPDGVQTRLFTRHPQWVSQGWPKVPPDGSVGRVVLEPAGHLRGQITLLPDKTPQAAVTVLVSRLQSDGQHGSISAREVTDSAGRYSVDSLRPGEYTVGLSWEDRAGDHRAVAASEHVVVRANETTEVDLPLAEGRPLQFEVTDATTGEPRPEARVSFYGPSRPLSAGQGVTYPDGTQRTFYVAPGSYQCFVTDPAGGGKSEVTVEVPASVDASVATARLRIASVADIRGTIRRKDGGILPPGIDVALTEKPPQITGYSSGSATAADQRRQSFFFLKFPVGAKVAVTINATGCQPWRSGEFTVGGDDLDVMLEPASLAPVRGRVVDAEGKPVAGVTILAAVPVGKMHDFYPSLTIDGSRLLTDANGCFETGMLRVGDTFTLTARGESGEMRWNGGGASILLEAHGQAHQLDQAAGLNLSDLTLR